MEGYKQRFRPKVVATHSSPIVVYPQGRASCSESQRPSPFVRDDGAAQRAASSDCVCPILASKFSSDNLTSKRINTKYVSDPQSPFSESQDSSADRPSTYRAWLQNIAATAARPSAGLSQASSSKTAPRHKPLNISNPEVVYQGAVLPNTALGMGAKRIPAATDAFS